MIESYLAQWALLTGGIWTLTEVLHRRAWVRARINADLLALIIGIVGSVVLTMSGFFETPEGVSVYWHTAGMVFLGLISVATAGIAHDKLIRPVTKAGKQN